MSGSAQAERLDRYVLFDRVNRPYRQWQLDQFAPFIGRRVLEVGCGVGSILELLGEREFLGGIDVEAAVLEYAARRFGARSEYRFRCADIGAVSPEQLAEFEAWRLDTIVCINVLEHVQDDLAALHTMEQVLVPGGTLALLVPAHPALYGAYDRIDGHFRRYTRAGLSARLAQTRFSILRLYYFNALGAAGWWVQYRLLNRQGHGRSELGLMNRVLPLAQSIERFIKPPFGLSLVAVCRR